MHSISILLVLTLAVGYTFTRDIALDQQWNLWKQTNNKKYSDAEEHVRRGIWENNLQIVQEHNLQADLGAHTYWLGMNKFADLTVEEFVKVLNSYKGTMSKEQNQHDSTFTFGSNPKLPDTVDWRTKDCVTHIKNQGQC